eukprot:scaffold1046_cov162-Ochromonas_danica.AAC.14
MEIRSLVLSSRKSLTACQVAVWAVCVHCVCALCVCTVCVHCVCATACWEGIMTVRCGVAGDDDDDLTNKNNSISNIL